MEGRFEDGEDAGWGAIGDGDGVVEANEISFRC